MSEPVAIRHETADASRVPHVHDGLSAAGQDADQADLLFEFSQHRLRQRCLWAGVALAASILLPYDVVDGHPQFLWQVLVELPPAAVIAAFAPAIAGVALVLFRWAARTHSRLFVGATFLGVASVATLAAMAVVLRFGSDAADWDLLPLPDSFTQRSTPPLLSLALSAAGATLAFRARARRIARAYLVGAFVCALAFYVWPARGEMPFETLLRAATLVAQLRDARLGIGFSTIVVLALWPLFISGIGLSYLRQPPARDQPLFAIVATFGLPTLLLLFVYQVILQGGLGVGVLMAIGGALALAAIVGVLASAFEVIGDGWITGTDTLSPGVPPARAAIAAVGAVVAIAAAQFALAHPPAKGVDWTVGAPTPEADRLFGELIPAWDRARSAWDGLIREKSSASALVEAKARAREMLVQARAIPNTNGEFAPPLETLVRESGDLDLAGRRWVRLVRDVNEASRRSSMPYYVDPTVAIFQTPDGLSRHFYVHTYAIESVHRWHAANTEYATLLVRNVGPLRQSHFRLGFSRDSDPFALVVTDEIEVYAKDLERSANETRCGDHADVPSETETGLRTCGTILRTLRERMGDRLHGAIVAATERHELQHQIDGPHLPLAGAVAELLAGYSKASQDRANRELSAYLAELTTEQVPPALGLLHLYPFGVVARAGAEHRVAVVVFEALSGRRLRAGDRSVDVAAMTSSLVELAAVDDDSLRSRARVAYAEMFGSELVQVRSGN